MTAPDPFPVTESTPKPIGSAGPSWLSRLVLLRYSLMGVLLYVRRLPGVVRSRRKLKQAGFVVRKTGGHLHALYRIGEEHPVTLCNIYGVPVMQTVIMGAGAMARFMPNDRNEPRAT